MNKSKIAIISTVINFDLYNITSKHFPKEITKYVLDGRNGMHGVDSIYYIFKKFQNKNIDWLVLADEDLIFSDSEVVFSIIENMKNMEFTVCGIRDGGIISHRKFNPHVVNMFFVILNFKEILKIWNKNEVKRNQFILPNEFELNVSELTRMFNINSLYEPYYCFFLWLKRNKKRFLFLNARMLEDGISNSILFNNIEFAYHTWFARSYKINKNHTTRINNILNILNIDSGKTEIDRNLVIYKDSLYYLKNKMKFFFRRLNIKLFGN